jgi:hypothetical protein
MLATLMLGAAFSACSGSSEGDPGGMTGSGTATGGDIAITSLAIDPPSVTLTVDQTTPRTQTFKARGTLPGGEGMDVPATFTVDNAAPGAIDKGTGLYTTSNAAGGKVQVTASYGGKTASAELTVIFKPVINVGNVPPDASGNFDPSTQTPVPPGDPLSPEIAYPSSGTMFPTNIYKILFQWRAKGLSLFHVRFEGPSIDLSLYTDGADPTCVGAKTGAGCWEATKDVWSWLASSAAGGSVKVTVEAADPAAPGKFYVGKSIDILFSKIDVPGAIYYWSTTQAGVMRATVSDSAPSSFMTPNEVNQCVACHTLSRNGKRLAADVGGENLWVVDVQNATPPPVVFNKVNDKAIPSAWATFNGDASRVVSAKGGIMRLIDGASGAPIGEKNGAIDLGGKFGTQPDWSPDSAHLVFAYSAVNKDRGIGGSSLGMLDQAGDAFTNLTLVRTATGTSDTYAYPMFDPTSQWIAYMHASGKSDKNPLAQIYIAKAQAGAEEIPLTNANTIVADGTVAQGIANNMPTWAPTKDANEIRWIAFASLRDYGLLLTSGSAYGDGKQQLWVAAIDPQKLGQGDPSFPAFRLPFQLLNENNHRPFWAEDALAVPGGTPEPGDGGACLPLGSDCSKGGCCEPLVCQPNTTGTAYTCAEEVPN